MSDFGWHIEHAIDALRKKGRWLESGTIEFEGELWSYKLQHLKKKPKKTKEADG